MERFAPTWKALFASLAICALCLALLPTGCVPPGPCVTDADCVDDGLFCNGGEVCVAGVCGHSGSPCEEGVECDEESDVCLIEEVCESDADCEMGEFCDVTTGECIVDANLFAVVAIDPNEDGGNWDVVHPLHTVCTVCHHTEPDADYQSCRNCHSDDPNGVNSFKDVAHDQNESGDGCAACHAAEFEDNCAFCHILLQD